VRQPLMDCLLWKRWNAWAPVVMPRWCSWEKITGSIWQEKKWMLL